MADKINTEILQRAFESIRDERAKGAALRQSHMRILRIEHILPTLVILDMQGAQRAVQLLRRNSQLLRHGLSISLSVSIIMCGIFYFLYIARLAIIFFKLASFSSSEMEGSFIKRPQGKSGHPPQFSRFCSLQHFQMGHTASPVY